MEKQGGASIRFDNVTLAYGEGAEALVAVRDVSFEASAGRAMAIIGPSGCGKSTLLHMAAGLLAPTAGTVEVGGQQLCAPRQETALIPQDLGLFPWKTVIANAELGLRLHDVAKPIARERAMAALEDVGLAGFERAYPKELSGGMRQRLALARALAMDADVLLMDEPLSAIDALLRESLQDMLLELWQRRGHTQLLVTHSIEEAVYLGQTVLVMSERPGTVKACVENPGMGTADWRGSDAFAAKCREVRAALETQEGAEIVGDAGAPKSAGAPDAPEVVASLESPVEGGAQ